MTTRLILTFGKNPLPVLVAGRRLCDHFRASGEFTVIPLYSDGSRDEYALVKEELERRVCGLGWQDIGHILAGDPESIEAAIIGITAGDRYHLHYTGGTKAMAVHAMEALSRRANAESARFEASYLDPNQHTAIGWNMNPPLPSVADERKLWDLNPEFLAELHGMHRVSAHASAPFEEAATALWGVLIRKKAFLGAYSEWVTKTWKKAFCGWSDPKVAPGKSYWPRDPVPWLSLADPDWAGATACFGSQFCPPAWTDAGIVVKEFGNKDGLQPWWEFINGGRNLEWFAFGELKKALPNQFKKSARFELRPHAKGGSSDCDIDVACVIGYQLLAISCTTSGARRVCKEKGFEVWLRMRQIGGDHARAILLCPGYEPQRDGAADELEADINTDIGIRDGDGKLLRQVRVWHSGVTEGRSLKELFETYFGDELHLT